MMVRRFLCGALMALLLFAAGCGEKKILHCDHCGVEVEVSADSNMDEDWIILCSDCDDELMLDDPA